MLVDGGVDVWSQFGLSGLVIAALFALIWFLVREHRAERSEWIVAYREQADKMLDAQRESNDVTRTLTAVVERLAKRHRASDRNAQ
ncbi:MAG: hypothetical protein IBX56_02445 [Methylomicrobium sp.]|nr:hypothetical protein [Methylomicrobium sp.]